MLDEGSSCSSHKATFDSLTYLSGFCCLSFVICKYREIMEHGRAGCKLRHDQGFFQLLIRLGYLNLLYMLPV